MLLSAVCAAGMVHGTTDIHLQVPYTFCHLLGGCRAGLLSLPLLQLPCPGGMVHGNHESLLLPHVVP